jgi:hypothetical protein
MLFTGSASARFGAKRIVLVGLSLIVAATSLSVIVGVGVGDGRTVRGDPALRGRARHRPLGRPTGRRRALLAGGLLGCANAPPIRIRSPPRRHSSVRSSEPGVPNPGKIIVKN